MAKETKPIEQEVAAGVQQPGQPAEQQPAPRPNRDKYSSMFAEDNPDVDFEDKEARYGRMAQERDEYRSLKKSGMQLTKQIAENRWLAAMIQDLANNPDQNPLVWLAENGIDIKAALDDEAVMAKVSEKFKEWQKKQVEGEAAEIAKDAAIDESLNALASVQQEYGLSDEQFDRMWEKFWDDVFAPAFRGEVSKDTWVAMMHAMNYDQDLQNAREEAALQGRNEKQTNKLKTFEEQQVPPSFNQGQGQRTPMAKRRKESLMDFVKRNT